MRSRLEHLCHRLIEVDALLAEPETASDMDRFRKLSRERAELEPVVEAFTAFVRGEEDLATAQEMLSDPELKAMAEDEIKSGRVKLESLEAALQLLLLPRDPNDGRSVFLEIRAGTGGDESALFSGDLLRMYTRYAEQRGWCVELMSESASELGGYKEVIARIEGDGAYGRLKFESGAHRVQRVPATEAQGRIHTSACTVAIMAEADAMSEIVINPSELRIDTFRASGAGGQHINKTDSAVRLTHIPTGIVVQCQNDRSQHRNRAEAMQMLKSKLYELEMRNRMAEQQKLEDSKTDVGWGHQIRSYVLDQSRIKDLRTNVEISNTQKVLDGDLDPFIQASLKQGV